MDRTTNVRYFAVATLLTMFGVLAIFSVGAPFFLTGLVMIAAAPLRRRRALFWGLVSMPLLFTLGYLSVAPLGCNTTAISAGSAASTPQQTSCSALFGEYTSRPSLAPAIGVGLLVATFGGAFIYFLITRHEHVPRRSTYPAR